VKAPTPPATLERQNSNHRKHKHNNTLNVGVKRLKFSVFCDSVMQDVDGIRRTLLRHKAELRKKFKVKTIGVFGSYVRSEQKRGSDLDVLVEFEEPVGLFEFMALENYLSDLLGVKVDLVSKKALKPHIGERIMQEVFYV
jgi:predicted nucleotidyltransferase